MATSSEVAYGAMGLFLCSCACGAVYIHLLSRKKQNFGLTKERMKGTQLCGWNLGVLK